MVSLLHRATIIKRNMGSAISADVMHQIAHLIETIKRASAAAKNRSFCVFYCVVFRRPVDLSRRQYGQRVRSRKSFFVERMTIYRASWPDWSIWLLI